MGLGVGLTPGGPAAQFLDYSCERTYVKKNHLGPSGEKKHQGRTPDGAKKGMVGRKGGRTLLSHHSFYT
jgi:hypothetical protein